MSSHCIRLMCAALLAVGLSPVLARADAWNERTVLTFSEAVMVPGATLPAGTYVFEIIEPDSAQHAWQITKQNESAVMASGLAVPVERPEKNEGRIAIAFYPTAPGTPPAVKAWYSPDETIGHQFVYPDEEARDIARRSKTVVLTADATAGDDTSAGELRTVDAAGHVTTYRGNEAALRSWNDWRETRATAAAQVDTRDSAASVVPADRQAITVSVDDLEDDPSAYIGRRVSVDAEVETVFGPRMFTIDEASWGDLDGEILVYMPSDFAALVGEDDRITVEGTVQKFDLAAVEQEWGWFGLDEDVEVEFVERPVVVADRIAGGDNDVAMFIRSSGADDTPVGTSGSGTAAITSLSLLADADEDRVGELVHLQNLTIAKDASGPGSGFFVESPGGAHVYVLPADESAAPSAGDTVSLDGVLLEMPQGMDERLDAPDESNDDIYVYAVRIG